MWWIVATILTVLIIANFAFAGYIFVKVTSLEKSTTQSTLEIKTKIGSLVREINNINKSGYEMDVRQQEDINKLRSRVGV